MAWILLCHVWGSILRADSRDLVLPDLSSVASSLRSSWNMQRASAVTATISVLDLPTTTVVTLVVSKRDVARVQNEIARVAAIFDLQAVQVDEQKRRLSSSLRVTLTGYPDQIASFRKSFAGAAGSGTSMFESVLDLLLGG